MRPTLPALLMFRNFNRPINFWYVRIVKLLICSLLHPPAHNQLTINKQSVKPAEYSSTSLRVSASQKCLWVGLNVIARVHVTFY